MIDISLILNIVSDQTEQNTILNNVSIDKKTNLIFFRDIILYYVH